MYVVTESCSNTKMFGTRSLPHADIIHSWASRLINSSLEHGGFTITGQDENGNMRTIHVYVRHENDPH